MCNKANELICKQQRPAQSQYGMLEVFMINFLLVIFYWFEAMLTDRLCRKSTSKKKIQMKAWYKILGTEILSYEELLCKTMQISEENELYPAKWNSLDSLASNLSYN